MAEFLFVGFFTLGIGQIFKVERLTTLKIAAVFTRCEPPVYDSWCKLNLFHLALPSFVGVTLVSLSDSQSTNPITLASSAEGYTSRPLFGDALALVSAIFYAFYVIFLKVKVKDESRMDMRLFFGFVGLFNMLTCWPAGFLLHWTGMETFELPNKAVQWYALIANVGLISSSPLFAIADQNTGR